MISVTNTVAALRGAVVLLAKSGDDGMIRIAGAVTAWLADPQTLEQALALPPCWRQQACLCERDQRIRELAARHWPELSGRPLARAIACRARQYETRGGFRRHQCTGRPPGIEGDLFDILSLGEMPGEARLRQLLNDIGG